MKARFVYKGGEGSGFHGHAGRPGKQGGSTSEGSVVPAESSGTIGDKRDFVDNPNAGGPRSKVKVAKATKTAALRRITEDYRLQERATSIHTALRDNPEGYAILAKKPYSSVVAWLNLVTLSKAAVSNALENLPVGRLQSSKNPTQTLVNFFEDENLHGGSSEIIKIRAAITDNYRKLGVKFDKRILDKYEYSNADG